MLNSPSPLPPLQPTPDLELSSGTLTSPSLITREQALRAYAVSQRDRTLAELGDEKKVLELKFLLKENAEELAQSIAKEVIENRPDLRSDEVANLQSPLKIPDNELDRTFGTTISRILTMEDFHPQHLVGNCMIKQWEIAKSELISQGTSFNSEKCDLLFMKLLTINDELCAAIHQVALEAGTTDIFNTEEGVISVIKRAFGSRENYERVRAERVNLGIDVALEIFDELNRSSELLSDENSKLFKDLFRKFMRGAVKLSETFAARCNELGMSSVIDRAFPR